MNDVSDENISRIKLDFSHPYGEYLRIFGVPAEKHDAFYEQFGYYLYSVSTPDDEKQKAFQWMIKKSANLTTKLPATVSHDSVEDGGTTGS